MEVWLYIILYFFLCPIIDLSTGENPTQTLIRDVSCAYVSTIRDGQPEGTEIVANAGNPNVICVDGKVEFSPFVHQIAFSF